LDGEREFRLQFLGATGTVTGSKYLVSTANQHVLIDCGLFQGLKQLRLRNWDPPPIHPKLLDAVILTHAHIDHSGYLPLLVRQGFRGRVYCTQATRDFCEILLPDSGYLQEEEAEYANRHGYSKHKPALPLYTRADAQRCLSSLFALDYGHEVQLRDDLKFKLMRAGHILGASQVAIERAGIRLLFSGDLGRLNDPIMVPPAPPVDADYLVLESTYGDRLHDATDPKMKLGEIINRTCSRGGTLVIPAFAVGRAQQLMYYISVLKHERAIPDIPVFLNSPMAADVTVLYRKYHAEHRLEGEACDAMCRAAKIVNTVEESKWLNTRTFPMVIISASGMATGGRVLHHLRAFAPDPRNTILFAGFQAAGTRGAAMLAGAREIKIHGQYIPVRAEVAIIESLSAHADYAEIISWAKGFRSPPRQTFITHGEPLAADALRHRLTEQLGWNCRVPEHLETQKLS
jgi:metallo-beta-lactamase family protein